MPRAITLNYAIIQNMQSVLDLVNNSGHCSVTYSVGNISTIDGIATYTPLDGNANSHSAQISITRDSSITDIWHAILAIIESQEGLSVDQGDAFFPLPH